MKKWLQHISISKLHFLLAVALMFALPFGRKVTSYFIVLWGITWIWERSRHKPFYKKNLPTPLFYAFWSGIIFYCLFGLGILFTKNIDTGLFDLQVKLSFIFIPLILYFSNQYYKLFPLVLLKAFLAGVITITSIYWFHMIYIGITEHHFPLYYTRFILFMHTSYFAMYLSFASLIVLFLYESGIIRSTWLTLGLSLFFFFSVYFTSAKSGLLSILSVFFLYFIYSIRHYTKQNRLFLFGILLLFIPIGIYYTISNPRFHAGLNDILNNSQHPLNTHSASSGSLRILLWETAIQLISENPFGYGTGDVKDVLVSAYKKNDIIHAEKLKLNTHNQFFETTIAIGIIGFLVLMALFIFPLHYYYNHKYWFFPIGFLLIVFINFTTESMLNRQTGIVFFVLFYYYILLFFHKKSAS